MILVNLHLTRGGRLRYKESTELPEHPGAFRRGKKPLLFRQVDSEPPLLQLPQVVGLGRLDVPRILHTTVYLLKCYRKETQEKKV